MCINRTNIHIRSYTNENEEAVHFGPEQNPDGQKDLECTHRY